MCLHEKSIIDIHEGSNICVSCGLVLSNYFEGEVLPETRHPSPLSKWADQAMDILDMIHMPCSFSDKIMKYFNNNYEQKNLSALIFSIYKVLNDEYDAGVSLKDLSNVTGVSKSSIFAAQKVGENIMLNTTRAVEKYCIALNLSHETIALIKDYMIHNRPSGHSPSTILAGSIYVICKKQKIKISIRKISQITTVSQISIQRFTKHVHS